MASVEMLPQFETAAERASTPTPAAAPRAVRPEHTLLQWVSTQSLNLTRHAAALRPFKNDEFGNGASAPTAGHIAAVNKMISGLRSGLLKFSKNVSQLSQNAVNDPVTGRLQLLVNRKERAHHWVQGIEKIWDFYLELFGQRQTRYANWLLRT